MSISRFTYLPLEGLMNHLKREGFKIGPNHYLRIQHLFNQYAKASEKTPTDTLKHQLGALLCRSEEELQSFYQIFDNYVDRHEIEVPLEDVEEEEPKSNLNWLAYVVPILGLLLITFFLGRNRYHACPENIVISISPGQDSRLRQSYLFDVDSTSLVKPMFAAPIDSIIWEPEPGKRLKGKRQFYRFGSSGKKSVKLFIYFPNNCQEVNESRNIQVFQDILFQPQIKYKREGKGKRFSIDTSNVLPFIDSTGKAHPPTQWEYSWDFGDGEIKKVPDPLFTPKQQADYQVNLDLQISWGTHTETFERSKIIQEIPRPELASRVQDIKDEDISDLLKEKPPTDPSLFYLLASGLLLSYLLIEAWLVWRRKLILDQQGESRPPMRHILSLHPEKLTALESQEIHQLALKLRKRRQGDGRKRPDIDRSIQNTARSGGYPEFSFKHPSYASQYLFLVEKKHPRDHLAQLFKELARELESRDISVSLFYYEKSPRICYRNYKQESLNLSSLLSQYGNYRLIIVGQAEHLLDDEGKELAIWTELLEAWREKAFLTNRSPENWGLSERLLSRSMLLAPASLGGLDSLLQQWADVEQIPFSSWKTSAYQIPLPSSASMEKVSELKAYLGPKAFEWLCACAWYPALSWELSFRLGKRIAELQAANQALLEDFNKLIQLFRLGFFRKGEIPGELRQKLAGELAEDKAREIRELLLQLLKEDQAPPDKESYAHNDQQIQIALLSYLNSAKDRKARNQLRADLIGREDDVRDPVSLTELNKVEHNPLALLVPARYFYGKVRFFGMRQIPRMILMLSIMFLGLGLMWWKGMLEEKSVIYDPEFFYSADDLILKDSIDLARWILHEGYIYHKVPQYYNPESAKDHFERAFSMNSEYELAYNNWGIISYEEITKDYNNENWVEAAYSFQDTYDRIFGEVSEGSLPASIDDTSKYPALLWLSYGALNSFLLSDIEDFNIARFRVKDHRGRNLGWVSNLPIFCYTPSSSDSIKWQKTLDSLSKESDFRQLLRMRKDRWKGNHMVESTFNCLNIGVGIQNFRVEHRNKQILLEWEVSGDLESQSYIIERKMQGASSFESIGRKAEYTNPKFERSFNFTDPLVEGGYPRIYRIKHMRGAEDYDYSGDRILEAPAQDIAIKGIVLGANAEPLPNVAIRGRGSRAVSDSLGVFEFNTSLKPSERLALRLSPPIQSAYQAKDTSLLLDDLTRKDVLIFRLKEGQGVIPEIPMGMVLVPGGSFQMGSNNGGTDEQPIHSVEIDSFFMDAREVSNQKYAVFLNAKGNQEEEGVLWYDPAGIGQGGYGVAAIKFDSSDNRWIVKAGKENHPVNYVSWYGAKAYALWMSEITGFSYSLPSEAQWEYAAKGGKLSQRFIYSGSNTLDDVAWYISTTDNKGTRPIGSKAPNELGIYDMSGNVWEWCLDSWHASYDAAPRDGLAWQDEIRESAILRGGSWNSKKTDCRVTVRDYDVTPFDPYEDAGFRLIRTVKF